jgi:hypothetical protein
MFFQSTFFALCVLAASATAQSTIIRLGECKNFAVMAG